MSELGWRGGRQLQNYWHLERWLWGGVVGLLLVLLSLLAWAFPIQVQVVPKVSLGKHPELVLFAAESATNAAVELQRDDGKSFTYRVGNLASGQEFRIVLDGAPGRFDYEGTLSSEVDGERASYPLSFSTVVATPLEVEVSRRTLDLEAGKLSFSTSRPVVKASLKVIGVDGQVLSEQDHELSSSKAQVPITIDWPRVDPDDLLRLELRVEDVDGFYRALALTPWSVEIPHEEVLFASDSSAIGREEEPKLQESLKRISEALEKYQQIRGVQLFIAGHTDTRGSPAHNAQLSRDRARAIAAWFARAGATLPIHYEGFGEAFLEVPTKDEVDEPKNRRVDYILGVEAPSLASGAYHWRRLN